MGRPKKILTEQELEERRRKERERYARRCQDPAFRAKERLRWKSDYTSKRRKNPERYREMERLRAQRKREKHAERINSRAREKYQNDPNGAAKQNTRRQRREPYRIIRAAIRDLAKGSIGVSDYVERINEAISLGDSKINDSSGK